MKPDNKPETDESSLIAVGRIKGTHGIRGQLRLYSYSGNIESLKAAESVILASKEGRQNYTLKRATLHSGRILLAIEGIDTIELAEKLVGSELLLHKSSLPEPEPDEYYWQDLLGLKVSTVEGRYLGTVSDILETGANDVYEVSGGPDGRVYLVPAIASVVTAVDIESGTMTITPLEGLLDL